METIEEWIAEDILNAIKKIDYSIEEVPITAINAVTHCETRTVLYNPSTASLFDLAEEYEHAKNFHRRQWLEYDVRNKNESEAHHLAVKFILERWNCYEGSDNWLTFMTVTGTPVDYEDEIIEYFNFHSDLSASSVGFG